MIGRFIGALMRALLAGLMVMLPAVLVPGQAPETAQVIVLFALFAAAIVLVEYAARYPGLIEFRYAPPYNRLRWGGLTGLVVLLALLLRDATTPSTLTGFVAALGSMLGGWLDIPFSPVRLVLLTLPPAASPAEVAVMRAAAGLAAAVALLMPLAFALTIRLGRWPAGQGSFNVWVNLPTFDPTAGGDVVARLERDARTNMVLAVLLPFVTPAALLTAGALLTPISQAGGQTQIWVLAAWAFLPAALMMRAIALARVARLIRASREAGAAGGGLQPV